MSMKNFSDTVGNRPRDLLTSSTLPQPVVPLRAKYVCAVPNMGVSVKLHHGTSSCDVNKRLGRLKDHQSQVCHAVWFCQFALFFFIIGYLTFVTCFY
jgi:hypothetical protein